MENRFENPEESGGEQKLAEKNGTGKAKLSIWIVIAAATFLVLALALGLGLGLGLKKSICGGNVAKFKWHIFISERNRTSRTNLPVMET